MRKPYPAELEELVRWFTRHMSMEMRVQLMGDMPVHYKMLYPHVDSATILARVDQRMTAVSEQIPPIPHAGINL